MSARRVGLWLAAALVVAPAPVGAQERRAHPLGDFEFVPTTTGVLVAAPHGTFDSNTASCAKRLGILASELVPRAIHLEWPRSARASETTAATAMLIAEMVHALLGERPRGANP